MDPFQSITIASACNVVFRKLFLEPNTIAIIPPNGYAGHDRHSAIAIKWLLWESHKRGIQIRHARNGMEHRINGRRIRVDGVTVELDGNGCEVVTKQAWEFLGDYFHGCPECYNGDQFNPTYQKRMSELHRETQLRIAWLRDNGWSVETKRECQFRKEIAENQELRQFLNDLHLSEPLDARDSFKGGRTNATKLYHCCQQSGEKIKYADINS